MTMLFSIEAYPFRISNKLLTMLGKEVIKSKVKLDSTESVTLCFKDETYSPEAGGFHPVEIRLIKAGDHWEVDYITDFCYVGSGYNAELVKELDFDFSNDYGYHLYSGEHSLIKLAGLYQLWEGNFLSYVAMDVFTVTVHG
ncbi:MAG TPA: DUF2787 family protein [Kangiella sp.]